MAPAAGYDFGAGRAGQIARHAGDAARAVARGAAGDRSAGEVADGAANAIAAAAKVVADIADDSARAARALSDEHGHSRVLARIASDADEARAAVESVADAAREAVYEVARAVPVDSPAGGSSDGGKAGAAANIDLFGIDVGSAAGVSDYVEDATRTVSGDTVEVSCSTAAFAARITSDAALAVASTAEAADCAARAASGPGETALDGPRSDAAAAATAIADEVDPYTARAHEIDPTPSEVLANLKEGPISVAAPHLAPTVANAAREATRASRLVYESICHARSFAARMELDCRAAIDLYG